MDVIFCNSTQGVVLVSVAKIVKKSSEKRRRILRNWYTSVKKVAPMEVKMYACMWTLLNNN